MQHFCPWVAATASTHKSVRLIMYCVASCLQISLIDDVKYEKLCLAGTSPAGNRLETCLASDAGLKYKGTESTEVTLLVEVSYRASKLQHCLCSQAAVCPAARMLSCETEQTAVMFKWAHAAPNICMACTTPRLTRIFCCISVCTTGWQGQPH